MHVRLQHNQLTQAALCHAITLFGAAPHLLVHYFLALELHAEKIRPLDGKLKNQIDKLVRAAAQQEAGASGVAPTQYRPNPEDLVSKVCAVCARVDSRLDAPQ